ncbi:hypothetical protein PU724_33450, partial [Mesorhizobium abyssinicae]
MQSFDQDELFAAAERAGPFTAASFASAQFGQDVERVVHSPAQSVDQPRSRAAIGVGYEALSSMPPPRVNLPATGFGSAPDVVNLPHVVADAYRPAANQQGDLTGARHTMPAAAPHQAAVVQQTRSRKRVREHPDEALFAAYRDDAAKTAKVSEGSIARDITALRKFSKWLDENHQSQIDGRIEDEQLDGLAKDFAGNDSVLLGDTNVALGRLRQHFAGQPVTAASTVRPGTKDDEVLFAQYRTKAVARLKEPTVRSDLAALRKFSKWLDENHRTQIAGRTEDPGLDALAKDFAERESARINPALKRLRQHFAGQPVTAASNKAAFFIGGTGSEGTLTFHGRRDSISLGGISGDLALGASNFHGTVVRPGTKNDEQLFAQAAGLKEGTMGGDLTGARHTMPAEAPHQASVVQQTRSRKRGREHPDEALFAAYRADAAKTVKVSESSIAGDITALRKFSKWLDENHRTQIAGRLDDRQLVSLAKNFAGNDAVLLSDINVALGRLRQHSAGQTVTTARARSVSEDNQVIEDACRAAASGYGKGTLNNYRSTLGRFNSWLSQNFGKGITQIEPAVLSRAVDEYEKNAGPGFGPAWNFLQRYRQMVAANNALGLSAHGQAASAWDVLRAFHEEEAAQRGAPMATNVPQFHQTTSLPPEWAPVPA